MLAPLWRACCWAAGASLGLGGGEARARLTAGLGREAGARRGAGRGPFVGAVRSAVPGPAFLPPPLLCVTGGSCGAGVPWSPGVRPAPQGQGLRFSFLTARGGGTAPACVLLEIATERVIASPKCMERLAVQVDRSPPRGVGVARQSLRSAADCSQIPEAVLGGMGTGRASKRRQSHLI